MLEKEIEKYFCWVVEVKLKGKTWKFASPNQRGVSDRIACLPDGTAHFVELKRPKGGRVSPLQQIFAGEMRSLNQRYALLSTKEAIDDWAETQGLSGTGC